MATISGRGVVWSVGAITYAGGITVAAGEDPLTQSIEVSRQSEKAEIKDNGGSIRAQVFHGFRKVVRATIIPASTATTPTIAEARSLADTLTMPPGTKLTLTDDSGTIIDASNLNSYNVLSAVQRRTVDGVAVIDVEMENGDESGIDITATVS